MIDTDPQVLYTENDLLRIAEETAKKTAEHISALFLGVRNLENFKETLANVPEGEETGMATLKAKIGDTWITGSSV